MTARPGRLALVLAAGAAISLAAPPAASAQSPAQRLVEAYAPILQLREQTEDPPCDTSEEQFQPTAVESVLGNPRVELEYDPDDGGAKVIEKAPTAADVAGLGEDFYLNVPGDPLDAGCTYAEDFAKLKEEGRAPAVAYAHIARERGRPGLAVQYFFFYYFNQFNDLHEGDWEGIQITFEADTPAAALATGPDEVGLFQHGGGEKARWDDDKVEKDGTHPIVYPAAGSHATFYDSAIYVENGQGGSGLGCDNTTAPLTELAVTPLLVPTRPPPGSLYQWLRYDGHWGQKEKGFNIGPQGPQTKSQWLEPFTWMEGVRETSPRLPAGSVLGPAVTKAFCGAVATVSDFVNLEARSPLALAAFLVGLFLLILLTARATRWRPVELAPLRRRRAFGQLVRASRQLYGRHWRTLVPIGLTAIPIIFAIQGIAWLAGRALGESDVNTSAGLSGVHTAVEDIITSFGNPVGYAIVAGAAIAFVHMLEQGLAPGFGDSYRALGRRFWRVVGGQLLVTLATAALALTVIGLPYAIKKYVDWQFVQQEILFEDRGIREAMRASTEVVRGHWWWTLRVAAFFWLLSVAIGPLIGFGLIFANFSLILINLIGSIVFALLVPYVALGRTLLYLDLEVRRTEAAPEPERRRRRWLPRLRSTPQPG